MEYASGNIYLRKPTEILAVDDTIVGHKHHFDHTTICISGALELTLYRTIEENYAQQPVEAVVEQQWILDSQEETPWQLILAGRHHSLRALRANTRFLCVYSHQFPQALSVGSAGALPTIPNLKTDDHGDLWVRVNPNIVQVTSEWSERYNR